MKVHEFSERLSFSEECGHEPFWQAVYRKAFPDMIFAQLCSGQSQGQRLGIDRVIHLKSGKTLLVDEKKREREYDDILLEYLSVDTTNAPGWIEKDLLIDFLAYAFMPTKRCYLFPWPILQRTWFHFRNDWKSRFKICTAQNNGYKTHSVAIPIPILLNSIKNGMIIQL